MTPEDHKSAMISLHDPRQQTASRHTHGWLPLMKALQGDFRSQNDLSFQTWCPIVVRIRKFLARVRTAERRDGDVACPFWRVGSKAGMAAA
jgi:hypothetical protein